jgi:protein involved in polysaccharide export with SLBB domain
MARHLMYHRLGEGSRSPRWFAAVAVLLTAIGGCASVTNPVADGVPVRRLPDEVLAPRKDELVEIPLSYLRQPPPPAYVLDAGDVLGVFIEGVLGDKNQAPPVRFFMDSEAGTQSTRVPAMGYPIVVGANGTLPLPLIPPLKVRGMSIEEAQEAVRKAYTVDNQILRPGRERILVNLMQPRTYHVLVVREDGGSFQQGLGANANFGVGYGSNFQIVPGSTHRGSGFTLELPAYKNDVLEALTRTGGLPGLDAKNEVVIQRGAGPGWMPGRNPHPSTRPAEIGGGGTYVRIPMRLPPGTVPPFRPEDVILHDGDIVFIEARDTDVFYTGGLLFAGQYPLPRDYDLDVVEALVLVRNAVVNGGVNSINFSGSLLQQGIGFPNPSMVTVLRQTPDCGQVAIHVDLNKALRDPRERVLIKSRDIIILQQTVGEALTGYLTNTVLKFNLFGTFIRQQDLLGTGSATAP